MPGAERTRESARLLSVVTHVYQGLQFWPYNPSKFLITLLNAGLGGSRKSKLDLLLPKPHFTVLSHTHKLKQTLLPVLPTVFIILTLVIHSVYSCNSMHMHLKCKCTNLIKTIA